MTSGRDGFSVMVQLIIGALLQLQLSFSFYI